ncbi:hypothetical protein HR45_07190 [Shewanella mangrovi]|uniref:Uncharacterized protein n=1 Tax=Shewanella mangrovi TaxID=1515746 RepID=A0A094JJN9_9GAMM|nr:TapY2 family type IVa secretion system protein [Shewanella mangrovi]KFZ38264.1 hypothetical protein HR45_07190 [Shewanella mangrovi]
MKILISSLLITTSILSTNAFAARVSYKCYLDTSKGKTIAFYRWDATNVNAKVASLVATKVHRADGKSYYVKEALECVPQSEDFASKAAKRLDKQTLR